MPPKKQKTSAAINIGFAFLEFVGILAAVGAGIGIGADLDNAMVSSFKAQVLAGIVVALMNEIGKKKKS